MAMLAGDESGDDEHLEDPDNVAQLLGKRPLFANCPLTCLLTLCEDFSTLAQRFA
jgi:hypothetical protein